MLKAVVYCPSRGRPDAAHQLWKSFHETKTTDDVELVFLLDIDDPTIDRYPTSLVAGEPTGDPTGPLNIAAVGSKADILGFMGDDSRFETVGWDARMIQELATPGICYGWDGHEKPWPSTVFISRQITDALGYMVPPKLKRGFFDVVWIVLAKWTGTERIMKDVVIPHDNSNGYVDPKIIAADEREFHRWQLEDAKRDAQRIRHAIYT